MFITLEGSEGSGKTSQLFKFVEWLREHGVSAYVTREPGGTSIGEQIREVIHDLKNTEMHPRAEALLYQAARAQIVEQELRPRLARGDIVICDRYYDSTLAYQGYGHQIIDLNDLYSVIRFATGGLSPDFTVFMDVDVEIGLKRKGKQDEINRMDSFAVDFYKRVNYGYHELIKKEPYRWAIVDANQTQDVVQNDLRRVFLERINRDGLDISSNFKNDKSLFLPIP